MQWDLKILNFEIYHFKNLIVRLMTFDLDLDLDLGLRILSILIENNFIESGQEHRFKPFNSIDNSGTIIFLIPSFSSEYIWLPR